MGKTWGEIRLETIHLGFDKPYNYEKQKDAFIKAFNWAQNHIAVMSGTLVDVFTENWTSPAKCVIDMYDKALAQNKGEFLHLANRGVEYADTLEKVEGIRLLDNRYLLLEKVKQGDKIAVYYCFAPKPINEITPDGYECQLPDKWAKLIPYYMANRLYLEDDTQKAGYYWNLAEDMMEHILMKEREPAVSVFGGIDIDGWCI